MSTTAVDIYDIVAYIVFVPRILIGATMHQIRAILLSVGDKIQVPGLWIESTVVSVRSYWKQSHRYVEVTLDNTGPITLDISGMVTRVAQ